MTTTPTTPPTSGAAIQRYKIGYHADEWGQRSSTPSGIPDASGSWVRYADHVTALAAGQATTAQAVVPAGWNLVPTEPTQAMLDAVVTSMDDFLLGKEAEKQYREDWAAMLAAAPAQPAAQQGLAYAALPTSNCAGRVYEEGFLIGTCPLYTADQLRAFADATYALRASHGQAPADLSPTAGMNIAQRILHVGGRNNDAGYVEFGSIQAVEALVRQVLRDLPAPAPADSVQEDAARYRLLRRGQHWSVIDGIGNDLRAEALDAAVDAARKQGASHDR